MPASLIAMNEENPRYMTEASEFKNNVYDGVLPVSEKTFLTREEDIDTNMHVNNTHYLAWAMETMPKELRAAKKLKTVKLSFKAECAGGEKITGKVYKDAENYYTHVLTRQSDGKEVFRLTSDWN